MVSLKNFKKHSFLVYGLGSTGKSVINFFKRNDIKNFKVWDDEFKNLYKSKHVVKLEETLDEVDHIVLSPGVSLNKSKNKDKLRKYKNKIITDIDLIYLFKKFFRSIVVTGTNGKSTTCKILSHVLKDYKYKPLLGGNIGTPVLNLKIKKQSLIIIEASSFQLEHSKFICPDYALLLNITNDHLDWHGSMKNYINSKFKIFKLQKQNQYSLINEKLKSHFIKQNYSGQLITPEINKYQKFKLKIDNAYLRSSINDENMSYILTLIKLLKIKEKIFLKLLSTFKGLPHRYEVFLKKKNYVFINDSKATSFQATKFALRNTKDIFWIVGGLPKKNDILNLSKLSKNIVKCYIIGKNIDFFKRQIKNKLKFEVTHNLKNSIIHILKDIKKFKRKKNNILLSPASASFDQFSNFEIRGEKFKKLSRLYARKYI